MGANCCVAARDKPLLSRNSHEASTYRSIRYSPSWSFRCDNRTHIEDIAENMVHFSHHSSGNATFEGKSATNTETDGLSDGESRRQVFPSSIWRRSSKFIAADQTTPGSSSPECKISLKSAAFPTTNHVKYLTNAGEPSSSKSCFISSDQNSRKPCWKISDRRISSLKSPVEHSSPEASRRSFVLSNDLSTGGSHGGSSDGWSLRTFSELVASSRRERWSFDSENHPNNGPSLLSKRSCSPEQQMCLICSKSLKEKSPWSGHRMVSTNDLPVVAVLVCSHVYHAECLECSTPEIEMYNPPCPVCANDGERPALKQFGRFELKGRNKISRIAVDDAGAPRNSASSESRSGKKLAMGASSGVKGAFRKPFLKRHFSVGWRPAQSASETARKKGFWAKCRRE